MSRKVLEFSIFRKKKSAKEQDRSFLFIIPSFLGFLLFYIWPFLISLAYSFQSKPVNGTFVWFKNYLELFQNQPYQKGLINTFIFVGFCIPINLIISLAIAYPLSRLKKYKDFFILIFLIPLVIPSGATAFFWKVLFEQNGFLNWLFSVLGMKPVSWFTSQWAMFVIILIYIWKNMGYTIVLLLAGLSSIPKEYYEAASVDSASQLQSFFSITVPCLIPTIVLTSIMSIINSFKVFKEIYLVMGAYPHDSVYMLQHFMNNMFGSLNYQKLTSATTILIVFITCLSISLLQFEKRAY